MNDKVKIAIRVRTEMFGSESKNIVECDRDKWDAMTGMEMDEWCRDVMTQRFVSWDWEVVA